jgi:hypothetical protein
VALNVDFSLPKVPSEASSSTSSTLGSNPFATSDDDNIEVEEEEAVGEGEGDTSPLYMEPPPFELIGSFESASSILDENEDEEEGSRNEKSEKNNDGDSLKASIKSKKAFSMAINDKTMPPAIKRLSTTA